MEIFEHCPKCGAPTFASANFCSDCGSKLSDDLRETRTVAVKNFVVSSLEQAEISARDLLKNKSVQTVAGGAALGATVATLVPFLTIGAGAVIGAAYVGFRRLTKE